MAKAAENHRVAHVSAEGHTGQVVRNRKGDERSALRLPQVTKYVQSNPPGIPPLNPELLPFGVLDAGVFERLVAELVSRRNNRGVQFYGRNGQAQHGLDIAERDCDGGIVVYQARRLAILNGTKLRKAVIDYAGQPQHQGSHGQPRWFEARRFVYVTSATLDSDTAIVDTLIALQDDYAGDLEIEAWGAETLSRMLRDMPAVVRVIFGPHWAEAFCGVGPDQPTPPLNAFGLVEDPVDVLNLDSFRADAEAAASASDWMESSRLFGVVATALADSGFPAQAAQTRERQADVLRSAGEHQRAFDILRDLALAQIVRGYSYEPASIIRAMGDCALRLEEWSRAEHVIVDRVARWYREGSRLDETVPALRELAATPTPNIGLLSCLVIEQALVDGLYDRTPPTSPIAHVDDKTPALLRELRDIATEVSSRDVVVRARLRCAVADASLRVDDAAEAVDVVYRDVVNDALAGRLRHGRELVTSRAARAFAVAGDYKHADQLWRRCIQDSIEHEYYGDTSAAMRASQFAAWEGGVFRPGYDLTQLPHQRRLLAGAFDPLVSTLEALQEGRLPIAFASARRFLWESRLSGQLVDEVRALSLFGDILVAAGHRTEALDYYIQAGKADKAVDLARPQTASAQASPWISSPMRRRCAAAVQVVRAQSAAIHDADVPPTVERLLRIASGIWNSPWQSPHPEHDAIKAIAAFGTRIPEAAVDDVLALAAPARVANTMVSDTIAVLLVQTYCASRSRRPDLANALTDLLRLPDLAPQLWPYITGIPDEAREPLLSLICELAENGSEGAIETLAYWRIPTAPVQRRARQACADMLRRSADASAGTSSIGTTESVTVDLLLALADARELVEIPVTELSPEQARPAGAVLIQFVTVPISSQEGDVSQSREAATVPIDAPVIPDASALLAAAPPDVLLASIAEHLGATSRNSAHSATHRVEAIHALRRLRDRIPFDILNNLMTTMMTIHDDPGFSEMDLFQIASNGPLSSARLDTGARHLPNIALLASAELLAASRTPMIPGPRSEDANRMVASAIRLLPSDDAETRIIGAAVIATLGSRISAFAQYIDGLLVHPDEHVRAMATRHARVTPITIDVVAHDPSAHVRAALVQNGGDLPEEIHRALTQDSHPAVRHLAVQKPARPA